MRPGGAAPADAVPSKRSLPGKRGVLSDGTPFEGAAGLRAALTRRPERFVTTVTEKLMTYALGRGVEHYDMPAVRRILRDASAGGYRLQDLVLGIVLGDPFRLRRAEP